MCLGCGLLGHPDLMGTRLEVNVAEIPRTMRLVEKIIKPRQRICVLDGELVQSSIIHTQSE